MISIRNSVLFAMMLLLSAWFPHGYVPSITWQRLNLGSGGFVTGLDIAPDGTRVSRTDISNAYIMPVGQSVWTPCVTQQSLAASILPSGAGGGVWEIVLSPNNSNRVWMLYGAGQGAVGGTYLFISDDQCVSWRKTTMPADTIAYTIAPTSRLAGQRIAVDPANDNVAYIGNASGGVYRTLDGGSTFTQLSTITTSSGGASINPGNAGIAFDPGSGTTTCPDGSSPCTNTVYVPSYGKGIWQSTDGGTTFTKISSGPVFPHTQFDVTVPITTTNSNDIIVIQAQIFDYGGAVISATPFDDAGLTWTLRGSCSLSAAREHIYEWWAVAASPLTADKISVSYPGSEANHSVSVFSVSGANTTTPFDSGVSSPPCGTPTVPTFSTANANDLIFTTLWHTTGSPSLDSGFTNIFSSTAYSIYNEYQIVSSTISGQSFNASLIEGGMNDAIVQSTTLALDPNGSSKGQSNSYAPEAQPYNVYHAQVACDGSYYVVTTTDGTTALNTGFAWKYASSLRMWTKLNPPGSSSYAPWVVAPAPSPNCGHLYVAHPNRLDTLNESLDGGATWVANDSWNGNGSYPGQMSSLSATIGWLNSTVTPQLQASDARWNPHTGNVEGAAGFCYWTWTLPTTFVAFNFNALCTGMESATTYAIIQPPGGNPLFAVGDLGLFYNLNTSTFPSATNPANSSLSALTGCWDMDYATATPTFVVALCTSIFTAGANHSGYSSSGGASGTWSLFATQPPWTYAGGSIAVNSGDTTNIIWMQAGSNTQGGQAYYTTNSAASWSTLSGCANVPASGNSGWGALGYFSRRKALVADKTTPNLFYAYNQLAGNAGHSTPGLFQIDNTGTCTLIHTGVLSPEDGQLRLASVPGKAGWLYVISGYWYGSHPASTNMKWSHDGGVTWTTCPGAQEVNFIAFGAPSSNPVVYIDGWVNGTLGVYSSADGCQTWKFLSPDGGPTGQVWWQTVQVIGANIDTPGLIYAGTSPGSGFTIGQINYLLNRDLDPAANDNTPAFLPKAA